MSAKAAVLLLLVWLAAAQPICVPANVSDTPGTSGCAYCALESNAGCSGVGVCYMQTVAAGNTSIPFCSCPYGLAPPQCAVAAPVRPICDNATRPPACQYCIPGTATGCGNGGLCFLVPLSPSSTVPPNSTLPVCGCSHAWAPPQCLLPSSPVPLCNRSDPASRPPACEYCRPGNGFPGNDNGCDNFGTCQLTSLSGPQYPPNFETPLCVCLTGWVVPTCTVTVYDYFGYGYVYQVRWLYVGLYLIVAIANCACIAEYLHPFRGKSVPLSPSSKSNVAGHVLMVFSAIFMACYFGNVNAIGTGGHTAATMFFQNFFLYFALAFGVIQVAVVQDTWMKVGLTSARHPKGFPVLFRAVLAAVTSLSLALALFFTIYGLYHDSAGRYMFLMTAISVFVMCVFVVVTGSVTVARVARSNYAADAQKKKAARLRRMASQLIALSVIVAAAVVVLVILVFLPPAIFTQFWMYYGLEVIFPVGAQLTFMCTLTLFFRFSTSKKKTLEQQRTGSDPSSTGKAKSGKSDTNSPAGNEDTIASGVITL